MVYFINIITDINNNSTENFTSKEDMDSAILAMHQTFVSAMSNNEVQSCLCVILDKNGEKLVKDEWVRQ